MIKATVSKLYDINWLLPTMVGLIGLIGVFMIYAATGGEWSLGAKQHFFRLIIAGGLMFAVALTDIRIWYGLAYPIYGISLLLLVGVDFFGVTINGSERWIDLGPIRLQPSEIMKLGIVMALARFYHDIPNWRISHVSGLVIALLMVAIPAQFILRQPDLGTTLLLTATGVGIIFLAGVNWRVIAGGIVMLAISGPLFFKFGLKPYQQERILTLLDPGRDPTGASYHITQSKIALGSGGLSGKGFMNGTQRQLAYVPENRTDFIFTVIGEEFGLIGGVATMGLYAGVIALCFWMSIKCKHFFTCLLIMGITITFALYVFINLAMVMGIAPVVGVPLPLISYGGSVMLTMMFGFGLVLSGYVHRGTELPRSGRGYGL